MNSKNLDAHDLNVDQEDKADIAALLAGKMRRLQWDKESEFESDTEFTIRYEVTQAQKRGEDLELPELDDSEKEGMTEEAQLERRIELELEERTEDEPDETTECTEAEAAAVLIQDYQRLLENMTPVLSDKTWELVNITFVHHRGLAKSNEVSLRFFLECARNIANARGRHQDDAGSEHDALAELESLTSKCEESGTAGATLEALKKVAELMRAVPVTTIGGWERLWQNWCNRDDAHDPTRWEIWRVRGGLFATSITELPEQFGVMHLGPDMGLLTRERDIVLVGFPTFEKGISDDLRSEAESKPTWHEKRLTIKERLEQKGAGPWTILKVEVTRDEGAQSVTDACIVGAWHQFPKAWDTSKQQPDDALSRHFLEAMRELQRRMTREITADRLIKDTSQIKDILLEELNREHVQQGAG
ncbi:MAG: hypothetical protein AWU57_56 [Marinobacter sp. T13-3]|nr:MAG: hypothetical protein AWU57_56 [Marinobacter sp. T13-3]